MDRVTGWRGAALAALCAAGAATAEARSVAYDQKTIMDDEVIMAAVVLQDRKFRMESVQEGITSVAIRNEQGLFSYLPEERIVIRLPALETSQGGVVEELEDYLSYVNERNGTILRQETLDGKLCDVYQFVDPESGGATTAWIWKEREFPLRLETDGPDGRIVVELRNIRFDVPVSPSMFEIPDGYEVVDPGESLDLMHETGGEPGDPEP
jgi:outer membrane lipoprotein-sorting protein